MELLALSVVKASAKFLGEYGLLNLVAIICNVHNGSSVDPFRLLERAFNVANHLLFKSWPTLDRVMDQLYLM
jgi:hypothetical protein